MGLIGELTGLTTPMALNYYLGFGTGSIMQNDPIAFVGIILDCITILPISVFEFFSAGVYGGSGYGIEIYNTYIVFKLIQYLSRLGFFIRAYFYGLEIQETEVNQNNLNQSLNMPLLTFKMELDPFSFEIDGF